VSFQPTRGELERFRSAIVQRIGLQFDDNKLDFLREVLQRRLDRLSCSSTSYLCRLEDDFSRGEDTALARELTVGETYFFRHNDQFRALAETVLPERMRARGTTRSLRMLSAGCASGEEPYSLAIVAHETIADATWTVLIRAVDLNPAVLEKASRGRYTSWALRDTPPELQHKWFRAAGREMILEQTVRSAVDFDTGNLASDDPDLWQAGAYDVIFCRNVLMYFAPDQMRAVIARIVRSLAPGGYLFLGHAETLRGISDAFHLCHTHDTFYYRRKDESAAGWSEPLRFTTPALPDVAPGGMTGTAWVDAIRRASERVAALVPAPTSAKLPEPIGSPAWDLAPAFELLRRERFRDALDHVRSGPPQSDSDPDVLLVKGMLLAHSGDLTAAEQACRRLLQIDELNAGAHYVLALCCEHAGLNERALEHDRVAAYLDPAFAMPRLHIGLLARRAGDRNRARQDLGQALFLLKREDASRLLLFGGGFDRSALMALCISALTDCGGRP
jgi:chemotaxis protein methyltransferase CheR